MNYLSEKKPNIILTNLNLTINLKNCFERVHNIKNPRDKIEEKHLSSCYL